MKTEVMIPLISGGIGLMALAIGFRLLIDNWHRRNVAKEGALLGFHRLAKSEVLPITLVPLLDRPKRVFSLILRGTLNGNTAGFFDIVCGAGKDWFYQSAIIVTDQKVMMPKFQIQTPQWAKIIKQRTCGDALKIPECQEHLDSLRLSSTDPEWARQLFSKASPQFYQTLRNRKWTIEGFQHSLVIYRWGQQVSSRKLGEYISDVKEISANMFSLCM